MMIRAMLVLAQFLLPLGKMSLYKTPILLFPIFNDALCIDFEVH